MKTYNENKLDLLEREKADLLSRHAFYFNELLFHPKFTGENCSDEIFSEYWLKIETTMKRIKKISKEILKIEALETAEEHQQKFGDIPF